MINFSKFISNKKIFIEFEEFLFKLIRRKASLLPIIGLHIYISTQSMPFQSCDEEKEKEKKVNRYFDVTISVYSLPLITKMSFFFFEIRDRKMSITSNF